MNIATLTHLLLQRGRGGWLSTTLEKPPRSTNPAPCIPEWHLTSLTAHSRQSDALTPLARALPSRPPSCTNPTSRD